MRLSVSIIADGLESFGASVLGVESDERCLRGVRLFKRKEQLSPEYLYLVAYEDWGWLEEYPKLSAVICCDARFLVDEDFLQKGSIICCGETANPEEVFQEIQGIFEHYADWYDRLQNASLQKKPLQELLEIAAEPLFNPLALYDPAFALLAMGGPALPDDLEGSVWQPIMQTGYVDIERIPLEERASLHQELTKRRGPFFVRSASVFTDKMNLMVSLYDGENRFATLASTDIFHPFTRGQVMLFDVVSQVLTTYLSGNSKLGIREDELAFVAKKIMFGGYVAADRVHLELKKKHWEPRGPYQVIVLSEISGRSALDPSEKFLVLKLRSIFPDALIFEREDRVVIVINAAIGGAFTDERQREAARLLDNMAAYMGVSFPLSAFRDLPVGYRQGQACIRFAQLRPYQENEQSLVDQHIFHFEKVFSGAMLHFADALLEGPCFCHPVLLSYAQDQDDKGKAAALVLSTYLRFGCNIVKTAQELGVHRNTVKNKIAYLENVLGCTFKSMSAEQYFLVLTTCMFILV